MLKIDRWGEGEREKKQEGDLKIAGLPTVYNTDTRSFKLDKQMMRHHSQYDTFFIITIVYFYTWVWMSVRACANDAPVW